MTALCVKQPWAELIASGRKTIETRTWDSDYRGPLLIVASKKPDDAALHAFPNVRTWPRGEAIATATVANVRPMREEDEEAACCGWHPTLYAWELTNITRISPFPVRGRLGLFDAERPKPKKRKR